MTYSRGLRLSGALIVLVLATSSVHTKPAPSEEVKTDSQLEQLKAEIEKFGKELQDLNEQIDAFVVAEKQTSSSSANGPAVSDEKRERRTFEVHRRQAQAEEDQALNAYIDGLSEQDKQLLQRMKSKVQYLQGAIHEPSHGSNPGESAPVASKRENIPEADPELQQFASQLSPEDQILLQKLSSKVKYLTNELHEGPHEANSGEDKVIKKSQVPTGDKELEEFTSQLSPEDQLILEKLGNRLKYLQGVLHEGHHNPNPGEEAPIQDKRQLTSPEDTSQQALEKFLAQLSPEDAANIKNNPKQLRLLTTALKEPTNVPNPGESMYEKRSKIANEQKTDKESSAEKTVEKTATDTEEQGQETETQDDIEFTAEDRDLLKTVATKLDELRQSLEAFKAAHDPPRAASASQSDTKAAPHLAVVVLPPVAAKSALDSHDGNHKDDTDGSKDENTEVEKREAKPCIGKKCNIVEERKVCVETRGEDCTDESKTETVTKRKLITTQKAGDKESMNLRQVLRALRKMKEENNEASHPKTDEELELDNLGIR